MQPGELTWTDAGWLAQAREWIDAQLRLQGRSVAGELDQMHVRPWATAIRVPTAEGVVWFKANIAALAHEAVTVELLARRRPELLPELLAVDRGRGWLLLADAGVRLRELLAADGDYGRWESVLPLYAELQIDAAADREALLAGGVPDQGAAVLPRQLERLLADGPALQPDIEQALSEDEVRRLRQRAPRVEELCAKLSEVGLADTVQHDDFHDGQIFVRDGRFRILDWGDACVAHPFFTLTVTLRVLAYRLELEEGAVQLDRFRDAYLEPWTRFRPRAELVAALPVALVLGGLCRALTWHRIARRLPPPFDVAYADAVPERLRLLLAALSE